MGVMTEVIHESNGGGKVEDDHEEEEVDSADEALLEMLGLSSLDVVHRADSDTDENDLALSNNTNPLDQILQLEQKLEKDMSKIDWDSLRQEYFDTGVCVLPELQIPSAIMRRLTDELLWGGDKIQADKTYETIQGSRMVTRFENFVDHHPGWNALCHGYLRRCISALLGEEMVLFKEKLNLKPSGGSGFAPHLDGPSLRVALSNNNTDKDDEEPKGPQRLFVTVMVAIDNMTAQNGCLRLCKGPWTQDNHCEVIVPPKDANPDAGGRAGAIPPAVAESMPFENLTCTGGTIAAFGEWTPHRSGANQSPFARRAVFLTYNPASEGDYHARYYQEMEALRNQWRENIGLANRSQWEEDQQNDLAGLSTIPKI